MWGESREDTVSEGIDPWYRMLPKDQDEKWEKVSLRFCGSGDVGELSWWELKAKVRWECTK